MNKSEFIDLAAERAQGVQSPHRKGVHHADIQEHEVASPHGRSTTSAG